MNRPGRTCPIDYRVDQRIYTDKTNDINADTIYVVGGLYGNHEALKEIEKMRLDEDYEPIIMFNGDIHWFDIELKDFKKIEEGINNISFDSDVNKPSHYEILGNVEAELIRESDINVGCGCSYPDCVDDGAVDRSNLIHSIMKSNIYQEKEMIDILKERQKAMVFSLGGKRIAITHGDEESLAGWKCSRENLSDKSRQEDLKAWFEEHDIDIIACTHTCAPAAYSDGKNAVINNGASGMPNFEGENFGLLTRISKRASDKAIYRECLDGLYIEALPIRYDRDRFLEWFDSRWPSGSPADISYRDRIVNGTDDPVGDAIISGFKICKADR